jgi:tape measure domain-containing protein
VTLFKLAVELFGDTTPLQRDMALAEGIGKRGGDAAGKGFSDAFKKRQEDIKKTVAEVSGIAGAALIAAGGTLLAQAVAAGSETANLRRQLQGVYGDQEKARKAVEALQDLSSTSGFGSGVLNYGLRIAGKYNSVEEMRSALTKQLDAAAAIGVSASLFDAYRTNLGNLQTRGSSKAEADDIDQLLDAAPTAISRIAQALGITYEEANKKIRKEMSGDDILNALAKVGEMNKGAATGAAGRDIPGALSALTASTLQSFASTGELLNSVGAPLIVTVRDVANEFGKLNKFTGGGAGLVVGISLLAGGVWLTARAYQATFGTLIRFTSALEVASVALNGLSASSGRAAIAGTAGGAVASAGGGLAAGAAGAAAMAILPWVIATAVAAAVAIWAAKASSDDGKTNPSNSPLGNWIRKNFPGEASKTEAEKQAEALKENTKALRDVSSAVIGGSSRARAATSMLEVEFAMAAYLKGVA